MASAEPSYNDRLRAPCAFRAYLRPIKIPPEQADHQGTKHALATTKWEKLSLLQGDFYDPKRGHAHAAASTTAFEDLR
jgi:hypothetical protein